MTSVRKDAQTRLLQLLQLEEEEGTRWHCAQLVRLAAHWGRRTGCLCACRPGSGPLFCATVTTGAAILQDSKAQSTK
jgi:hypothetical protein